MANLFFEFILKTPSPLANARAKMVMMTVIKQHAMMFCGTGRN